MLRYRVGMVTLFLVGLAATTVAQTPAPTKPAAPAAAAPASDKQKFEIKLEKDKPFYQKMKTEVSQVIKVQSGSDLTQKHEQTFLFKWLPTAQNGDKWTLKQTIEGVKMAIDIAGNQVKYDSTTPNEPNAGSNPGLADLFGKLIGTEFIVTLGKGMVVEKVDGASEFLKKLGGVNTAMESILKKMLTDEALKQMCDPSLGITPATEQPVGGTWEKTSTLNLGPIGSYEVKSKYTYKGKDTQKKDFDRIEVTTTMTYKAPTDQAEGLIFKIKSGNLTTAEASPQDPVNYILYNPKTGRIEESRITAKLKGTLNVTVGGTDTTLDLYQEQTTTVETSDKSFLPEKK